MNLNDYMLFILILIFILNVAYVYYTDLSCVFSNVEFFFEVCLIIFLNLLYQGAYFSHTINFHKISVCCYYYYYYYCVNMSA